MPLPFSLVCDLLEQSNKLCLARRSNKEALAAWFARHRQRIDAHDTNLAALLSTLLPEKRTDRIYCIQARTLEKIIARALGLGCSRVAELASHREPGRGEDLADCVERLLTITPNAIPAESLQVSVEEIDRLLHGLASRIRWSSPAIRASQNPLTSRNRVDLEAVYRRLTPREAKWFTRLVLKNYQPLIFDSDLVYRSCDPFLPCVLKVRDDFASAIQFIQAARTRLLPNSARPRSHAEPILSALKPQLGVKVGRQFWLKARSIKHCFDLGHGRMSIQDKIDGEYCQIHVDVTKRSRSIQIFSKSGKDSTEDRSALLGAISDSLRLYGHDSGIRKECILEGELVVYSELEHKIQPFHKIRNHVTRRGRFLFTDKDPLPNAYEHLMIVYYDILLLDGESLLNVRHSDRLQILQRIIHVSRGTAEIVRGQFIDFDSPLGASNLRKIFAQTIISKSEGLVLKTDDPYFDFSANGRVLSGRCIKLKKEYIGSFGDVGDFAVVGAGYDPVKAKAFKIPNLKWTHFFIGCLNNKEEVKRWHSRPEFTVVNAVGLNESLMRSFVSYCNTEAVPFENHTATILKLPPNIEASTPLVTAFTDPPVFDLRCFSFDRAGDSGFWSLRFPTVSKIHFDRDFSDAVSFSELQSMAAEAIRAPSLEDSQENLQWIARLERADPRGVAVDAVSQQTGTTEPTPSLKSMSLRSSTQETGAHHSPAAGASPVSADGSPQTVRKQTRSTALPLPPVPLMTPPTSSATAPAELAEKTRDRTRKRSSPPSGSRSPARKRRRSGETSTALSSSPSRPFRDSQSRKPLEDIDANSSQRSGLSFLAESQKMDSQGAAHSSAAQSFAADTTKLDSFQAEQFSSQHEENPTTIMLPEFEAVNAGEEVMPSPRVSITLPSPGAGDHIVVHLATANSGCLLAGGQCHLAKVTVLSSTSFDDLPDKTKELLTTHGLRERLTDLDTWLGLEKSGAAEQEDSIAPFDTVLLVDTQGKKSETKATLQKIEEERKNTSYDRRHWISVYDWRVLEHLAIMEDERVKRKYFDGFQDPWRRWYCGLV